MELLFFSFPLFVICNVEKRNRDLNVELCFNSGKHQNDSECKEPNIAQLFICKGEKVANAGYLEKQIFVKVITCTKLSGSV